MRQAITEGLLVLTCVFVIVASGLYIVRVPEVQDAIKIVLNK